MKWYWILLFVLIGAAVVVVVVGALLPVHHQAACRAVFRQPPSVLFTTITDVAGLPTWRKELQRVEALPDQRGLRTYREYSKFGPMDLLVEEQEADRKLVTRIITPDSPFGGTWTFKLVPVPSGTEITITENGEIYNPAFRFMSRFLFGHDTTLKGYLKSLAAKFGETPVIEPGIADPPPPGK